MTTSANISDLKALAPPGVSRQSNDERREFQYRFPRHFHVPPRIAHVPRQLVRNVNAWHYAMINDHPRNEFYYRLLQQHITPDTGVLDIGTGSGLLSMMAARLGARWVVAVEGSAELARLAQRNVEANGLADRVRVINRMSTELQADDLPEPPDVLVSELFGALLLGESAHIYLSDLRRRLLKPTTRILPQYGRQYAVPIECPALESIRSVTEWQGIDVRSMMSLKDTSSLLFTSDLGFRMSSVPYRYLCAPICIASPDFAEETPAPLPPEQEFTVEATGSGTAHAMLLFWEVEDGGSVMSTEPQATLDNFPRDIGWGQALQLLDAETDTDRPTPVVLEQGRTYGVVCRSSARDVNLQFGVRDGEGVGRPRAGSAQAPSRFATPPAA